MLQIPHLKSIIKISKPQFKAFPTSKGTAEPDAFEYFKDIWASGHTMETLSYLCYFRGLAVISIASAPFTLPSSKPYEGLHFGQGGSYKMEKLVSLWNKYDITTKLLSDEQSQNLRQ